MTENNWTELSEKEQKNIEQKVRDENKKLMKECITDAEQLLDELLGTATTVRPDKINVAVTLFDKRAVHSKDALQNEVNWKIAKGNDRLTHDQENLIHGDGRG